MPESSKNDDGNGHPTGKQVTVETLKVATRALWIMGISIILVCMCILLSCAYSQMADYFDKDYGTISWVLHSILYFRSAVTIVIGRLADTYGPKKMLLIAFVCYTVGTILAGFATEFYTLLIFRIIQGVAVAPGSRCCSNCTRSVST